MLYYADGSKHFWEQLDMEKQVATPNFDSYISRLDEGKEFGLIAAYRKEHPLRSVFERLSYDLN
ncbi:MAG: hypothetical protein K6G01_11395 [Eubacterium sp.]|nr:hypothetical protein [Eubacterium sp.]